MINKQKLPRYEMHKYWGKKPAFGLAPLIKKYSKPGDLLLDPFAGYGVFCSEAYIAGRNVIANDLNPIANFIEENLLDNNININKVLRTWTKIKDLFIPFVSYWYKIDGTNNLPISVLRDHEGNILKARFDRNVIPQEITFTQEQNEAYRKFENEQEITDWYPQNKLIPNSRISAKKEMTVADLFTKRQLACHARLYKLIKEYSSGAEQNILLLAFTANLANCSVLVPPIKTRGEMAQGAWMTGFYTGETYIENNVLHYFENRLAKVISGKKDYYSCIQKDLFSSNNSTTYKIMSADAKHLPIDDGSIDYVFTDPPYGDTVPYFEQSIIWNAWLKVEPDYQNEIVVSNSGVRNKDGYHFEEDIQKAFSEIRRVLKKDRHFSLTYHSLSGEEWKSITNACIQSGFELETYEWLTQKTFTPRQLNRVKTVKGDVLITLRNSQNNFHYTPTDKEEQEEIIKKHLHKIIDRQSADTNEVMIKIMEWIFSNKIIINDVDIYKILKDNFAINDNGLWTIK